MLKFSNEPERPFVRGLFVVADRACINSPKPSIRRESPARGDLNPPHLNQLFTVMQVSQKELQLTQFFFELLLDVLPSLDLLHSRQVHGSILRCKLSLRLEDQRSESNNTASYHHQNTM